MKENQEEKIEDNCCDAVRLKEGEIAVSLKLIQATVDYLTNRPYGEVANIMDAYRSINK